PAVAVAIAVPALATRTLAAFAARTVSAALVDGPGRNLPLLADRLQADLALRVDLLDLHAELVALLDGVLHPGQALALPELRDVHEAVASWNEVHEGAEGRRLDHGAVVLLAHEHRTGVRDVVDHRRGFVGARSAGRSDVDRAVVLDVDVGAGERDDLVDPLALRSDDLADLVDGDVDAD